LAPRKAREDPDRPDEGRRGSRSTGPSAQGWWLNKRGTLRGSCRVVRPRLYGERDILVAEGWIPDRGKGGACVGARPAWIPGSGGTRPRSMRSGWHFFSRLSSKAAQPFSPAVVIKRRRLRPLTGQPPSVCLWTRKEMPGVVARGSLTRREAAYTVRLTSPLTAWWRAPGGKGVSEEGGRG
jgi:hypothetical protein